MIQKHRQEQWYVCHPSESQIKVSILVCTRNRAPYAAGEMGKNPLTWFLQSILWQQGNYIGEVVIVDDASNDNTPETIDYFSDKFNSKGITLKYERNNYRKRLYDIRNQGISLCKEEWIVFGDDDCVFSPFFIRNAVHYIEEYQSKFNLGVIVQPCFYRSSEFTRREDEIGKVNIKECKFVSNFNSFPKWYVDESGIEENGVLYKPIEVQFMNGVSVVNARILKDINFRSLENFNWDYGEWISLGYSIYDKNFKLIYIPNPCAYAIHFKYGVKGNYERDKNKDGFSICGLHIDELVALSSIEVKDTGQRCTREEYYFHEIGGLFSFFYKKNVKGSLQWAIKTYEEFVLNNIVYNKIHDTSGLTKEQRKKVWEKAISAVLAHQ